MQNIPSRSVVLTLFGAAFVVYFIMLGVTIPALKDFSGGLEIFDLSPRTFQLDAAVSLLENLGEAGRAYYLWRQLPLDVLYPGLMGTALSSGIIALRHYVGWQSRLFAALPIIPLIAAGFDYAENVHVIVLLTTYPSLSPLVCTSGFLVGVAKSAFYVVGIIAFFACLLAAGVSSVRNWHREHTLS